MIYVPRGALILTRGNSWLARLIRWGQRAPGEPASRVNHSLLVIEPGYWPATNKLDEPVIIESDRVVRVARLGIHAADKMIIWDIEMTEAERVLVASDAMRHKGRPYAVLQLIGQLIDNKLLRGLNFFRRLAAKDPLDICSHLTGDALAGVGIVLGVPGYAQSPDDQDDFLRKNAAVSGRRVQLLLDDLQ